MVHLEHKCQVIYQESKIDNPSHLAASISMHIDQIINILNLHETLVPKQPSHWTYPPHLSIKLIVDISFILPDSLSGIGFVLKNDMRKFIDAGTSLDFYGTAEEAECKDILFATIWATALSTTAIGMQLFC